ncbi:MAG: T9SS type A sorting domain-containing protein, partial [Flavobacteriales bacterium]
VPTAVIITVSDPVWGFTDSLQITLLPGPDISFVLQAEYCFGDTLFALSGALAPMDWLWENGDTTSYIIIPTLFNIQSHSVMATSAEGCVSTDSIAFFGMYCVGIEEVGSIPEFRIAPNPADDELFISSGSSLDRIEVFDAQGRSLMELDDAPHGSLWIGSLAPGIYSLRATDTLGRRAIAPFIKR